MYSMFRRRFAPALLAAFAFALTSAAQTKPADDPFSDANRADAKPAAAQKKADDFPLPDPFAPRDKSKVEGRIDFTLKVTPAEVRRGETVKLELIGVLQPGFYTYPLTQRAAEQPDGQLATIKYENVPGLQPLYPAEETKPDEENIPGLGLHLKHKSLFTWGQDILVLPDAKPGKKTLPFSVRLQVCDETCITGELFFSVEFTVTDAPAVELTPQLNERMKIKNQEIKVVEDKAAAKPGKDKPAKAAAPSVGTGHDDAGKVAIIAAPSTEEYSAGLDVLVPQLQGQPAPPESGGLLAFVLQGMFWGAVSLITPCVFPMIPITVSFFLKQSESKHYRPVTLAVVYSVTIVVVLTIAAVALLSFFRWLSVHPLMNFGLGALFVFFALSLFGMYDIELPSFLTNFTSSREGQGGLVGTVFMALTFTLVSFACVAPFLGGFGGTAAGSGGMGLTHRVLGGLAFAATFAAPFFVLALFPGLLKKMPKSGSWLNSVKVVMGFLELAAALKFFRAGELVLIPLPVFFTYDLVLGMWIALGLLCGLYLLNFYRLPHDTPSDHISVPRLLFGFCFLSLSFYLLPALFKFGAEGEKQRPAGSVYAWVDSFLLPEPGSGKAELAWGADLKQVVEEVRAHARRTGQQQLVFLDFTGETCTNCKINEHSVFPKPEIKSLFQAYKLVQLYTDKVPDKYYAPELRARFGSDTSRQRADAAANLAFQKKAFDTEQLPLYVILEPRPDGTLAVLGQYTEGKINDEAAFARFLQDGLAKNGAAGRAQARAN